MARLLGECRSSGPCLHKVGPPHFRSNNPMHPPALQRRATATPCSTTELTIGGGGPPSISTLGGRSNHLAVQSAAVACPHPEAFFLLSSCATITVNRSESETGVALFEQTSVHLGAALAREPLRGINIAQVRGKLVRLRHDHHPAMCPGALVCLPCSASLRARCLETPRYADLGRLGERFRAILQVHRLEVIMKPGLPSMNGSGLLTKNIVLCQTLATAVQIREQPSSWPVS